MQASAKHLSFDVMGLLTRPSSGLSASNYRAKQTIYSQGDPADSVFYVNKGKVKVTVTSPRGKEAIVAIRGPDEFCGEGALTGKPLRLASVTAMSACSVVQIGKSALSNLLHRETAFADYFLAHLLTRTARVEADLVDHLFNSSELRLARALLLLSNYGMATEPTPLSLEVNQETLAELIGTTRSRVNFFMNKFRKLGLIDYNGKLEVHPTLLNYVLLDQTQTEI
jgi:CRP/FNR family transcriptional regulator, cyclic AMP receptor protein